MLQQSTLARHPAQDAAKPFNHSHVSLTGCAFCVFSACGFAVFLAVFSYSPSSLSIGKTP